MADYFEDTELMEERGTALDPSDRLPLTIRVERPDGSGHTHTLEPGATVGDLMRVAGLAGRPLDARFRAEGQERFVRLFQREELPSSGVVVFTPVGKSQK